MKPPTPFNFMTREYPFLNFVTPEYPITIECIPREYPPSMAHPSTKASAYP